MLEVLLFRWFKLLSGIQQAFIVNRPTKRLPQQLTIVALLRLLASVHQVYAHRLYGVGVG